MLLCKPKHVGADSIILIFSNNSTFFYVVCVIWDNKVIDIIEARL